MTDKTRPLPLYLPPPLYEWLRRTAFEQHLSMNKIVIAALEKERGEQK